MTGYLRSCLWDLPSVRQFLRRLGEDLQDGRILWVLLPQGIDPGDFRETLIHHLERNCDLQVEPVDLRPRSDPFEVLKESLGWYGAGKQARVLEDLASYDSGPRVLFLRFFENLPVEEKNKWVGIVERWASAIKVHPSRRLLCIVIPADALPDGYLPQTDIAVSVRMWWGIPSALEVRLACRLAAGYEDGPRSLWRESLIPSVAGNDLELGEALWDVVTDSRDTTGAILEALVAFAGEKGWNESDAAEACRRWKPPLPGEENRFEVSPAILPLWVRGWVVYTPEYGGEVHSALLALLGYEREIVHRVWRAQAALLLPFVDSARLIMYDKIHDRWGWLNWQDKGICPELGELENTLRCSALPEPEKQQLVSRVTLLREVRNRLAHYHPLSFAEFTAFWDRITPILGDRRGHSTF